MVRIETCGKAERDIQRTAVAIIKAKKKMEGAKIIANPFSELQMHYTNQAAKFAALANAKAAGWEKSQPDLIVIHKANGFSGLAIELKKQKENPFRAMNNGMMWLEGSKSEKVNHVWQQAYYLHQLREQGFYACFASGVPEALKVINDWCLGTLSRKEYRFDYSYYADCMIYRV